MKVRYIEGTCLKLGENAAENHELLTRANEQNFYWVHLDSFPSGHVIIENTTPSIEVLKKAGEFCLEHTKFKSLKNVRIVYTTISNLILSDNVGEVEFKSNRKTKNIVI